MSRGNSESSSEGEPEVDQEGVTVEVVTMSKAILNTNHQLTPKSLRRVRFKDECQDIDDVLKNEIFNLGRVEWPPRESVERDPLSASPSHERVIKLATVPPMHIGTVAITKARRKRIDEDFKNFQGAAPVFSSSPFAKAGFAPNKLSSEKRWKPSVFNAMSSKPPHEKPHKVLRSSSSILTQGKCCNQVQYKMPPGTAKVHKQSTQGI